MEYTKSTRLNEAVVDEIAQRLCENVPANMLFRTGKTVVQCVRDTLGGVDVYRLDVSIARNLIAKYVRVFVARPRGEKELHPIPVQLCRAVVHKLRDVVPLLNGVVSHPIVTPSGTLVTTSGYNAETGLYVRLCPALEDLAVPETPTDEDVAAAREQIAGAYNYRALRSDADQARYVATLLTTVMRSCYVAAPLVYTNGFASQGDGYVIAREITALLQGETAPSFTNQGVYDLSRWWCGHREKGVTLLQLCSPLEGQMRSLVHNIITQPTHQGRIVKGTQSNGMRNTVTMLYSRDELIIPSRLRGLVLPVSLEWHGTSPMPLPVWARYTPRSSDMFDAVRADVCAGLLTLIRAWQQAGSPAPTYDSVFDAVLDGWYAHVAGVMEHAGYTSITEDMPVAAVEQRRRSRSRELRNEYVPTERWVDVLHIRDAGERRDTWNEVDSTILRNGDAFAQALNAGKLKEDREQAQWLHNPATGCAIAQAVGGRADMLEHGRALWVSGRIIANAVHPYTYRVGVGWGELADVQQIADDTQQALHALGYSPTSAHVIGNVVPRRVVVLDEAHSLYLPETQRYGNKHNISVLFVRHDIMTDDVMARLRRDCNAGIGALP